MEKIQKKVANKKRPQETMPIDESLADIPEWRKPLREWWSRTGPTHPFTINSGTQPEKRNSGVVLGGKRCRWLCGGNYEIAQIAGESLNKFDFIFLWYIRYLEIFYWKTCLLKVCGSSSDVVWFVVCFPLMLWRTAKEKEVEKRLPDT